MKVFSKEITVADPGVYKTEPLQARGIKIAVDLPGMFLYMPLIKQNGSSYWRPALPAELQGLLL